MHVLFWLSASFFLFVYVSPLKERIILLRLILKLYHYSAISTEKVGHNTKPIIRASTKPALALSREFHVYASARKS
ncbi:hypothetical protein JB92DRAFT_3021222 [Gautieria morchelliformis]|nr:hypothetical protein JB92DRAFT_3021222 [Gautieria morchelliformis]